MITDASCGRQRGLGVALATLALGILASCQQPNAPLGSTSDQPDLSLAPMEPPGFFVLTDWPMDALTGNGWSTAGAVESGNLFVVGDTAAPGSQPHVAEWRQTHSFDGAYGKTPLHRYLGRPREVYLAFWLKLNAGWQGSTGVGTIYHDGLYPDNGPATTVGIALDSCAAGERLLALSLGDEGVDNTSLENSSVSGGARHLGGNVNGGNYAVAPGQWHHIEIHVRQSTSPTARDGLVQWWANGTPVGAYNDVNFLQGAYDKVFFYPDIVTNTTDTLNMDDVRISVPSPTAPGSVGDVRFQTVSDGAGGQVPAVWSDSVGLRFTAVDDGTGTGAKYDIRYSAGTMNWGSAQSVTQGTCATLAADADHPGPGMQVLCRVHGLSPNTTYAFQLVPFRGTLNQNAVFGPLSNVISTTTPAGASSAPAAPGTVHDLGVTQTGAASATLSFTEVDDGTGHAARYDVRYAATPIGWGWGSATVVTQGTCRTPVAGTAIGTRRTCTVDGLSPATSYDFQMVAYRGTLNAGATFGGLSNVATGVTQGETTARSTTAGTAPPAVVSGGAPPRSSLWSRAVATARSM